MYLVRLAVTLLVAAIVATGTATAADLAREPIEPERRAKTPFARCSYLDNIFLFGDPTDCPLDETVPQCDARNVVGAAQRFLRRAHPAYRAVKVVTFADPREVPDTRFSPSPLVRRYCAARVALSNGDATTAYYFLEEDAGFVGLSWSVSVCVLGYDEWRVYDGRCRVARPMPRY